MGERYVIIRTFAPLPETERGRTCSLNGDPSGKKLLYTIGCSVIIRDVDDPSICEVITHHAKKATVACYAPSGFYICSGDASGVVKIWDTVNIEHMIKYEYRPISGSIYDISWSGDSKRVVAVGEGREKYGLVFNWDTGTKVGDLTGHTKAVLSTDFKKTRPFGIITAGEDMSLIHHKGPPFKYDRTTNEHGNFVSCVRYSPNGLLVASSSLDGKIVIYDGLTLEKKYELVHDGNKAHAGGIYAISWSPCGNKLLSASGDKTCKIWNVIDAKCETVFPMGHEISDQQLGCLWMGQHLITASLSGKLSFLDPDNPEHPKKYYWGHNKGIVSMALSKDKSHIYTGSYDGTLNCWNVASGVCEPFKGMSLKNQITCISLYGDLLACAGVEDKVVFTSLSSLTARPEVVKTKSQPLSICAISETVVLVGCLKEIMVIENNQLCTTVETPFEVTAIAVSNDGKTVALGGSDKKVHFCQLCGSSLKMTVGSEISTASAITWLSYSSNGQYLLVACAVKYIHVYDSHTLVEIMSLAAQSNKVTCADWSPDDRYFATCGVDGNVNIWSVTDNNFHLEIRGAHRSYNIVASMWIDPTTVASVGQQDCSIKFWRLSLPS